MVGIIRNGLPWLISSLLVFQAQAFYIPGWSIKSYNEGEHIPLMVNKVYSDNTQLQYAYYDLPFVCPPTGKTHASGMLSGQSISLNLGEVLRGDRIKISDIDLNVGHDNECTFLCDQEVTRKDLRRARDLVKDGYVAEWIVDNLPGATSFVTVDKTRKYYAAGFKLGFTDYSTPGKPRYFLNNHHTIVIRYRSAPGRAGEKGGKVVVGFEVYTKSIGPNNKRENGCPADLQQIDDNFELYMASNRTNDLSSSELRSSDYLDDLDDGDDDDTMTIPYSYSVYFREDDSIPWERRWDLYFVNQEEGSRIHWLAIINSLIICGLLTGIVAMILSKTVRSDIRGHKEASPETGRKAKSSKAEKSGLGLLDQATEDGVNLDEESEDEALEDATGWKLLHGDVFRRPQYGHLLAPLVGSGMQLLFMAIGLIVLSAIGLLNPSFRGGFLSFGFGLFVFAGVFSGYFSAKVYQGFGGVNFGKNALITACFFPGLLFGLVFMLNLFVWAQASSTAIPFSTLLGIALLWLCFQVPLVYLGSWYGHTRSSSWENPTKTNSIPRQIPQQAWYIKSFQSILLAGLIPFTVIFIELLFLFQSVWQDKSGYYYVFGFLGVVSLILMITVAEVTIVTIYVQLSSENYHWWWQSFAVGGGSAVWVFIYSIWYYMFKLHITGFVSSMLFFVYSFIACCVYGLLTGTVGFLSAYAFVQKLYSAIKID
ncbi:endomembrane protein 70 [Xylariaceae sp. FL0255]|nr:endomembrane protein 70 [Xylariaceae sp. FL0255]